MLYICISDTCSVYFLFKDSRGNGIDYELHKYLVYAGMHVCCHSQSLVMMMIFFLGILGMMVPQE